MISSSKALKKLFYQYTHLPLGGKEIRCPYWMNELRLGIVGPGGGKGRPEDIVRSTREKAREAGLVLTKMSEKEILALMKRERIGVDCSGFAFWLLDALDRENGGKGLLKALPATGRFPASLANVKLLTSAKYARPVSLADIKVGDMLRLRAGRHIAVIFRLKYDEKKLLFEIDYAHSSVATKTTGVHLGTIVIKVPGGLEKQEWLEENKKGQNYGQTSFRPERGDGLYRLRLWE